ncbi:hypothetical protein AAFF_G00400630 [Aldrovandia affinis]|uniref:Uncharacterized protein n=1 Tax=Aldrovandia affinis TaxID=143900 RepID=A0AAD7SCQ2_9TELE|nr:hypothetical protein AAFF_G00400630 [Aldrovandia affinis]
MSAMADFRNEALLFVTKGRETRGPRLTPAPAGMCPGGMLVGRRSQAPPPTIPNRRVEQPSLIVTGSSVLIVG